MTDEEGMPTLERGAYVRPTDLGEALRHLQQRPSVVLAGGTDLVLLRAGGIVDPAHDILDIKHIPALRGVRSGDDGSTEIGTATPLHVVVNSTAVGPSAISDGADLIGGWQTRVRGTIGGNICRASPAGDSLPGMLVSRAEFLLSSYAGSRIVPAKEFFVGPSRTVLRDDELLERIVVPQAPGASAYKRFTPRRAMDLAVVGVAAYVEVLDGRCVDARVALSAAAATPVLACDAADALIGSRLDESAIRTAAALVLNGATPIDDARGSREQRRAMLPVLAYRAVTLAHTRALAREQGERRGR